MGANEDNEFPGEIARVVGLAPQDPCSILNELAHMTYHHLNNATLLILEPLCPVLIEEGAVQYVIAWLCQCFCKAHDSVNSRLVFFVSI